MMTMAFSSPAPAPNQEYVLTGIRKTRELGRSEVGDPD